MAKLKLNKNMVDVPMDKIKCCVCGKDLGTNVFGDEVFYTRLGAGPLCEIDCDKLEIQDKKLAEWAKEYE